MTVRAETPISPQSRDIIRRQITEIQEGLDILVDYLIAKHDLPMKFKVLKVVHNREQDRENRRDPRAFCAVDNLRPSVILTTTRLAELPLLHIWGVLFHELGHVFLENYREDQEAVVDAWCCDFAPELEYRYASVSYPTEKGTARAVNVQRITIEPVLAHQLK